MGKSKGGLILIFSLSLMILFFFSCTKIDRAFSEDSNGKKIYFTGYNSEGVRISFNGGPHWLYMHWGSCVDCHGTDGRGGVPVMMLYEVPPDIRYEVLTSTEHHHGGGEADEHEVAYTDELIIRAIREGIEADGEAMSLSMPRWNLSDKDAQDLLEFIKGL